MSLGVRFALVVATVAALTAVAVGGASYLTTNRQVTAEVDTFLKQRVGDIDEGRRGRSSDRRDNKDDNDDDLIDIVSADAVVQYLDPDGRVLSSTGIALPVTEIDRQLADKDGPAVLRTVAIDGSDYRLITDHLSRDDGAIQVARSLDESAGLLDVLRTRLLVVAGLVALLAGVVGWIVAQRTTRPLRALSSAVDEVAQTRDLSTPVPESGNDEVGRLAREFNQMLQALQRSEDQQRRLVQDAAHELRTPITSVTANVDWLLRAGDIDSDTRNETLTSVRRELGELNDVMAEVIELATDAHEPAQPLPLDLVALAQQAVDRFVDRTNRDVTIVGPPTSMIGDHDGLTRAVTNLLNNAHKYSPANKPIEVHVGAGFLFVDDAGPGIPEHDRQAVFDRFYRRDEDRSMPGSGLGLAIVARIVDQHGGSCVVTDSHLGGARIGFSFPAASELDK